MANRYSPFPKILLAVSIKIEILSCVLILLVSSMIVIKLSVNVAVSDSFTIIVLDLEQPFWNYSVAVIVYFPPT